MSRFEYDLAKQANKPQIEQAFIAPFNDISVSEKLHKYERSRIMIVGPSMSGKTNLLLDQFLANSDNPPFTYTQVFIFGTAVVDDPLYQYLRKKEVRDQFTTPISWSTTLSEFQDTIKTIKKVQPGQPGPLIIIDDMTMFLKQDKGLNNFVTMARHKGASMVFSLHKFNKMDKMAREQMNIIFVTKMNPGEVNTICKECCGFDYYSDLRSLKKYMWLRIVDGVPDKLFNPSI